MKVLLGIDIGTSGTKTVLFDTAGAVIASAMFDYPLYQPVSGWAEQEPEDWAKATINGIKAVLRQSSVNPKDIAGIGLSGQMHGLVMLDKDGKVLRKSIIWCDQRTANECIEITQAVGAKRLIEITANPALTGFTASKILWVKKNEPEIFKKCHKILLPKDYIRYVLSGTFATEVSDASGMQLLDIRERKWSDEILSKLGIKKSLLAPCFESQEITSKVSKQASVLTGLTEGTPIAGGAGDQEAAAIGNGIIQEGVMSCVLGSSGVIFAHTDKPIIDRLGRVHTFCHAVNNAWHIMSVTQGAGLSMKWFKDTLCQAEQEQAKIEDTDVYVLLNNAIAKVPVGSNGVTFLPYLMGERSPILDPNAKGLFFGLTSKTTKADMARAVMEGVTFSQRHCMEVFEELGIRPTHIVAGGGGAKSPIWRQMLADVLQTKILTARSIESGSLGVAILAGVGVGLFSDIACACNQMVKFTEQTTEKNRNAYSQPYQRYKKTVSVCSELF